jgi:hypothetical protein
VFTELLPDNALIEYVTPRQAFAISKFMLRIGVTVSSFDGRWEKDTLVDDLWVSKRRHI